LSCARKKWDGCWWREGKTALTPPDGGSLLSLSSSLSFPFGRQSELRRGKAVPLARESFSVDPPANGKKKEKPSSKWQEGDTLSPLPSRRGGRKRKPKELLGGEKGTSSVPGGKGGEREINKR